MKTMAKITIFLAALTITIPAYAESGHDHHHSAATTVAPENHTAGKQETIQGQLIGLTCFIKHGATGKSHKKCAVQCAEKGLPLGILTEAGAIYQVSASGHGSLQEANAKLLKYAEEKVLAVGETFTKNGMNMIVIEKIKQL